MFVSGLKLFNDCPFSLERQIYSCLRAFAHPLLGILFPLDLQADCSLNITPSERSSLTSLSKIAMYSA